jgi:hypothetical protein
VWATLGCAAVGALGAAIAGYVNLAKHFRERNQASANEKRRWSLEIDPRQQGEWRPADLRRSELDAVKVRLLAIRVLSPRTSLIAFQEFVWGTDGRGEPKPVLASAARKLLIDQNLKNAWTWVPGQNSRTLDYSQFEFYVSMPRSESRLRKASRRVVITVDAEEISSARRPIRIRVASQPIDWSASAAQRKT